MSHQCFVVDIDDTLLNTLPRTQAIWKEILNVNIPLEELDTKTAIELFKKYATQEQIQLMNQLRTMFQDLLLCRNQRGIELMSLDEPIPNSSKVLRELIQKYKIIYLTGRLNQIREPTLNQLKTHRFPLEGAELVMFSPKDWEGAVIKEARTRLVKGITSKNQVVKVIDDFPGYFSAYKEHGIPDRIGFHRSKRFKADDYLSNGATRVISNWSELTSS